MRQNNFDIVRLSLASLVVLFHIGVLSASPALTHLVALSGPLAVEGFFAISGFLIFASYERTCSLREYAANRAWRILPGYLGSTVLCVLLAFSFGGFHVGRFLLANLTFANFLHPGVPGVFEGNPENSALNGSLWTIKIELMFYAVVPAIVWCCRRLKRDAVLWTLFALSIAYRMLLGHGKAAIQLPGQLSYFMIGALVFYHLAWFKRHGTMLMVVAAMVFALHAWTGWYFLRPAAVAALTLGACQLLPHVQGPARWGDFSYGTYVLHYPLVQTMVALGAFRVHPWGATLLTVCMVAMAATCSWFLIEKPCLTHSKSRRLRRAALGAAPEYPPAVP